MAEQRTATEEDQPLPRWLEELRPGGVGLGFSEKHLRHSLMFIKRPVNRLLVTFDNLSNVSDTSLQREPWAFKFAQDCNISHLGIMAHVKDWYRDPDLIARMQKLADEGFFNGYDRVVFAGVSMGGFAAIAFASLVPGAHVVSVNPQSTLNPDLVPWETRYENGRRQDWTLPLSDAAALTGNLGPVNIFYDPYHELDKNHVARFSGDNIRIFNCRYSVHKTAVFLRKIGALKPVMQAAIFDELTAAEFYKLYRARRNLPWFRGSVAAYFNDLGRDETAERFTKAFRERLRKIKQQETVQVDDDGMGLSEGDPGDSPEAIPVARKADVLPAPTPQAERQAIPPAPRQPEPAAVPVTYSRRNDMRTIVTTMKNEGPFMLEWVAHNRAIGFTDFMIYTNDCDDGTDKIAMRLEELGVATHIDNTVKKGVSPQRAMLRKSRRGDIWAETDWIICADCDEFLNIRVGDGTLDALFEEMGETDGISFCWKLFGCGEQVEYKDRFVTEQFVWAAPEGYRDKYRALGLKTMFRPNANVDRFGVHRPKFDSGRPEGFIWRDGGGRLMDEKYFSGGWSASPGFTHDMARLHHYSVRSIDSFLVKRDRGRTNHVDRDQGLAYWADMNLNMEKDTSLLPMVERTRAEFDKLMTDPELARLHHAACDWHKAKIDALKAQEDWAQFHGVLQKINRPGQDPKECEALVRQMASQ